MCGLSVPMRRSLLPSGLSHVSTPRKKPAQRDSDLTTSSIRSSSREVFYELCSAITLMSLQSAFDSSMGRKGNLNLPHRHVSTSTCHIRRGLAVFAFTIGCRVGVDIEQIRGLLQDMQSIASRFFCSEEATELMSLIADQRELGFYLCWTRKEAYIKAIGDGLSASLDSFRVTLRPGQPARFIHLADGRGSAEEWTLTDLQLAPNYAAALAYHDMERPVALSPVIDAAEVLDIATAACWPWPE